jgi:hypothetical protein
MRLLQVVRRFAFIPLVTVCALAERAQADEVLCSTFPGGVVTGTVNAELIVDCHCVIAPGALVNGNIKQPVATANWNINVKKGASVNGNIYDEGGGSVQLLIVTLPRFGGHRLLVS